MTLRHPVPPSIHKMFLSHTQRSTHTDTTHTHTQVQTSTHKKTIVPSPLPSTAPGTQSFCNGMKFEKKMCAIRRGGGLGSSTIFKKFNEPYAPS